ncbi:MAG: aspartate/glutamate racemase family protein [Pseudomonadota bacterium]|nr:aspartate/glutamate racemase family protein [Pseudomonadota bacterium]
MSPDAPIGIIDSGIGCFTVLRALRQVLPKENWLVLQDREYAPYGQMTDAQIIRRTSSLVQRLQDLGVKAVILACHSSSSLAHAYLSKHFQIPIIDLLRPTARGLAHNFLDQNILWLATTASIRANKLPVLSQSYGFHGNIVPVACPGWVDAIESDTWRTTAFTRAVHDLVGSSLLQFKNKKAHILLGCTHYPWIKTILSDFLYDQYVCIDPADWVAHASKVLLDNSGLMNSNDRQGMIKILDSARIPVIWRNYCQTEYTEVELV